jgi:rare lipoprotein A
LAVFDRTLKQLRGEIMRTKPEIFATSIVATSIETLVVLAMALACSQTMGVAANTNTSGKATVESKRLAGGKTASGQRYNPDEMVAASSTLPIGSKVKVQNKKTGKSAIVRINDRTAKKSHSVVDLSNAAANKLGVKGTAQVNANVVGKDKK